MTSILTPLHMFAKCERFVTLGHRKYIFYINQVYIGSTCYISVNCHNPPIIGYHIYGLPHFTPVKLSPISSAHSTITVCTTYNEEAKLNVISFQSVLEYVLLFPDFIPKPKMNSAETECYWCEMW